MPIHTEFASWQPAQPLETPLWICAVVGAGVAKRLPGTLLVAEAGTRPGTLASVPRWQLSHVVEEGMCELEPIGLVAGMTMILATPAKLVPVTLGPWQATQLFVIPVWLMREALNFAPLGTGVAAMLEPAPTWQSSHEALVGRWLAGSPTMLNPFAGIAKLAAAAPWHCAQFALVLSELAWIFVNVGIDA